MHEVRYDTERCNVAGGSDPTDVLMLTITLECPGFNRVEVVHRVKSVPTMQVDVLVTFELQE